MDIVVKDGDSFRKLINCLKELITDAGQLTFDSRGISMQSTDTANVVMIDMLLEKRSFERYKLEEEQNDLKLGLNFGNLSDILKLSKCMQIGLIYKNQDKLSVKMYENNNKKIQFNMNLSDCDKPELEITDINYEVIVYIETSEFQKTIKDISTFGKRCNITVHENEITFSVNGDKGVGEISINDIEIEYTEGIDETKKFSADFSTKYLNFFAKASLANEIILKFADGVPFCFEYELEEGFIRFYLTQLDAEEKL